VVIVSFSEGELQAGTGALGHLAGKTGHGNHAFLIINYYGGCHGIGSYLCLAILTSK